MLTGWVKHRGRRLWLSVWPPGRTRKREVDRRLQRLCDAMATMPSKHDDPEYRERFLRALFDGTYRHEDFDDRPGPA